ncbi:hypothetical protein ACFLSA_05720, partial [Bacteroidota bacterium]
GWTSMFPELMKVFENNDSKDIKSLILRLIVDVKDQSVVPHIVALIKNVEDEDEKSLLVSSCWQSRLDFSYYLNLFSEIVVTNDYQTALEAFTVIENSLINASEESIKKQLQYLKNSLSTVETEKKLLVSELIKTIETF